MWLLALSTIIFPDTASALCFVSERVTTPKAVLAQPPVIDEYHCKILCAEMDTCISYLYDRAFNRCSLLGNQDKQQFMCTNPRNETVRKTEDADCPDSLPPKPIEKEYIRDPATEAGTIIPIDTSRTMVCGTGIAVIDVTLPDNSHGIYGNTADTNITWDEKLGSWILQEDPVFVYVRAAQCITVNSKELGSRESCGDALVPECTANMGGYSYQYPIKNYGEAGACVKPKNNIHMQYRRWSTGDLAVMQSVYAYVQCIFGQWFIFGDLTRETVRVSQAHCVKKTF